MGDYDTESFYKRKRGWLLGLPSSGKRNKTRLKECISAIAVASQLTRRVRCLQKGKKD